MWLCCINVHRDYSFRRKILKIVAVHADSPLDWVNPTSSIMETFCFVRGPQDPSPTLPPGGSQKAQIDHQSPIMTRLQVSSRQMLDTPMIEGEWEPSPKGHQASEKA
jgi:hypothetical protein